MQSQSSDLSRDPAHSEKTINDGDGPPNSTPAAGSADWPDASGGAAGASMQRAMDDVDQVGRLTTDAGPGASRNPESRAGAAVQAGKAYAKSAVNSAGKKMEDVKTHAAELKQRGMQFVADEPWKAAACAAAAGGVLTAALMSWMRGRR
ncbi:hypothetical protein GCM10023165_50500 [Variovorax defluvii]|uniref:DUF883 domain-containing protein n=1 Tax=Variovorax defluvii TaxID=913761 RepID=A0ABP8IEL5_9BURK